MGSRNSLPLITGLSFANHLTDLQNRAMRELGESEPMRMAVALHDAESGILHTFADNSSGKTALSHYSVVFNQVPSLRFAITPGAIRVIDDMNVFAGSCTKHTRQLLDMGYRSSYAMGIHSGNHLLGIVFLNATSPGYFTPERQRRVAPYAELAALHVALELSHQQSVHAAVTTARQISAYRDTDTAEHLARICQLSEIIGDVISEKYGLSDEFIEKISHFAAMHDIGKVGVPDSILLKPGKLTAEEFETIKGHVAIGADMVEKIISSLGLGEDAGIDILRNIVKYHHERLDGSGYPYGVKGSALPIEAQIVAVADVFDALMCHRPYKPAWPIEKAMATLREMTPHKLNLDCVNAIEANLPKALEVMRVLGNDQASA